MREKIDKIKTDYVSDEELEMGKRVCNIMEDLYFSQTTGSQANVAAQYEILGLGYDYRDGFKEKIDAVSKEDVRDVARKYFKESAGIIITPEMEEWDVSLR
jgi:predicted Zn-dependent peptidase